MIIKDIKEKLIDRLKRPFRESICFDIADVKKIVDEVPESEFTPILVDRNIIVDNDKLFDIKVADVIDYLSAYKEYERRQELLSYESCYFKINKKGK